MWWRCCDSRLQAVSHKCEKRRSCRRIPAYKIAKLPNERINQKRMPGSELEENRRRNGSLPSALSLSRLLHNIHGSAFCYSLPSQLPQGMLNSMGDRVSQQALQKQIWLPSIAVCSVRWGSFYWLPKELSFSSRELSHSGLQGYKMWPFQPPFNFLTLSLLSFSFYIGNQWANACVFDSEWEVVLCDITRLRIFRSAIAGAKIIICFTFYFFDFLHCLSQGPSKWYTLEHTTEYVPFQPLWRLCLDPRMSIVQTYRTLNVPFSASRFLMKGYGRKSSM